MIEPCGEYQKSYRMFKLPLGQLNFLITIAGEGASEALDEIELVFKPHPVEMTVDNSLMRALKDNTTKYIKTTANATGECRFLGLEALRF